MKGVDKCLSKRGKSLYCLHEAIPEHLKKNGNNTLLTLEFLRSSFDISSKHAFRVLIRLSIVEGKSHGKDALICTCFEFEQEERWCIISFIKRKSKINSTDKIYLKAHKAKFGSKCQRTIKFYLTIKNNKLLSLF